MSKLKVFRAVSGFHDSYVAVPSRAAALRAWGASTDLFAMGAAEEVTDPKLAAKALESPGTVFTLKRGAKDAVPVEHRPKPRAVRKPSREALDRAERALEQMRKKQAGELDAIGQEIARLDRARREMLARHKKEAEKKETAVRAAEEKYSEASDDL